MTYEEKRFLQGWLREFSRQSRVLQGHVQELIAVGTLDTLQVYHRRQFAVALGDLADSFAEMHQQVMNVRRDIDPSAH